MRSGHPNQDGYVKEGWTGLNEWVGYIPANESPYILDPPKGYVALANNKFIAPNKYNLGWNTVPTSRGLRLDDAI